MSTSATHAAPATTLARIVLWVEDPLTKEYLHRVWQNDVKLFDIRVGGGNEGIRATVHDQRARGATNVFGLIDRDFGNSNRAQWLNPASGLEVFVPDVHEMENYLLDWPALEGCGENRLGRTQADVAARAEAHAQTMVWWMSCRAVIAKYRNVVCDDFPVHPKVTEIPDQSAAQTYLSTCPWYGSIKARVDAMVASGALGNDLAQAHSTWSADLTSGRWTRRFSGKEIFRAIRGHVLIRGGPASELDVDLAKSVGEWQHVNNRVPQDMRDILQSLRKRVGLESW